MNLQHTCIFPSCFSSRLCFCLGNKKTKKWPLLLKEKIGGLRVHATQQFGILALQNVNIAARQESRPCFPWEETEMCKSGLTTRCVVITCLDKVASVPREGDLRPLQPLWANVVGLRDTAKAAPSAPRHCLHWQHDHIGIGGSPSPDLP